MSIEEIKQNIKRLREMRLHEPEQVQEALEQFRGNLHTIGFTVFWSTDEQDYALYCNE